MVLRFRKAKKLEVVEEPRGFDAFDLRLGDLMRGERATMGKSLLDVEREIRIRASYIAAIENADPNAFDTPGFIPGYVRSYARYLGMDPDDAFNTFCTECGFAVSHGMSADASSRKPESVAQRTAARKNDPIIEPATPFVPAHESIFSKVEPGAVGSAVVLIGLISAIGFGGWTVLNEVQQVRLAPVENTPNVLTDLDPLDGAVIAQADTSASGFEGSTFNAPSLSVDRTYRPEALDVPVIVARDAPISTLDPSEVGTLSPETVQADSLDPVEAAIASVLSQSEGDTNAPRVLADAKPPVRVVAVRPAWIRVTSADGSIMFEGTLNSCESYEVPAREQAPQLRVGESGSVYFQVAEAHFGPVGPRGTVTRDVSLAAEDVTDRFEIADLNQDNDLSTYVADLTNIDGRLVASADCSVRN